MLSPFTSSSSSAGDGNDDWTHFLKWRQGTKRRVFWSPKEISIEIVDWSLGHWGEDIGVGAFGIGH